MLYAYNTFHIKNVKQSHKFYLISLSNKGTKFSLSYYWVEINVSPIIFILCSCTYFAHFHVLYIFHFFVSYIFEFFKEKNALKKGNKLRQNQGFNLIQSRGHPLEVQTWVIPAKKKTDERYQCKNLVIVRKNQ